MNKVMCSLMLTSLLLTGLLSACSSTKTTALPGAQLTETKKSDGTEINSVKTADGSEDTVTTEKNPDGTTVRGGLMGGETIAYSPDFPLEQYPGSRVEFCGVSPTDQKARAELSTTDPVANVDRFYRDQLKNNGWKIVSDSHISTPENKRTDRLANMVHLALTAHKDTRVAELMILDPSGDSPATISIDVHTRYIAK